MATSENYRDQILRLLPRGRAWAQDSSSWLFKFAWAMGTELARVDLRVRDMLREIDPRHSLELLPDYEREYGLPNECTQIADSIETRRRDLIARITSYGGQSADYFIELFDQAGSPITISYIEPTRAGRRAGSRLYGRGYRFRWNVDVPVGTTSYFVAGEATAGDPLFTLSDDTNVICIIEKNKPAHTYVTYTFST